MRIEKYYTGISVDEDLYWAIRLRAGKNGHSFSRHLNFILASLERMSEKEYREFISGGVKICLKRKSALPDIQ